MFKRLFAAAIAAVAVSACAKKQLEFRTKKQQRML